MPSPETPPIEMVNLKGLSLKLDIDSRDPASWEVLNNFDCYIDGSIRKCLPPIVYGQKPGPLVILNFIDWRANDSAPRRIIGFGSDSKLYDLTSGAQVGDASPYIPGSTGNIPWMGMMPGTLIPYNFRNWKATTAYSLNDALLKYSFVDGMLYIYVVTTAGTSGAHEQPYTNVVNGTITDGSVTWTNIGLQSNFQFILNYLVIQAPGYRAVKWDGTNVTQVGVSAPGTPVTANPLVVTPNFNGYGPIAGAFYAFTLFNPQTLHESSPSPLFGPTTFYATDLTTNKTINGAFISPLPQPATGLQPQSYQEIRLCVRQSAITAVAIGQGFTHVRFYRTKDGGGTLFLLTQLFDINGNIITNSDGSIPIASLSMDGNDYEALPTPQAAQPMLCAYDGFGNANLAPNAQTLATYSDFSSGKIVLQVGGGQGAGSSISNSFTYVGTGGASGNLFRLSPSFTLAGGTYAFRAYMDATSMSAGTMAWYLSPVGGAPVLTLSQTAGARGFVSASGAVPAGTYYLITDINGTVGNGNTIVWSDPLLQLGASNTTIGYPTPDSALVTPSPPVGQNNPPPVGEWAAIFGNCLIIQDEADKVKLWYSDPIDFESFGAGSSLRFPSATDDQITCLLGTFQSLMIGKRRLVESITGEAPNFTPAPVDPSHGILGKRCAINLGSNTVGLLNTGLSLIKLSLGVPTPFEVQVGYSPGSFVGEDIQPFTDAVPPASTDKIVDFTYNTRQDIVIFALQQNAVSFYNDLIVLLCAERGTKFSTYSALVTQRNCITVREVELPSGAVVVLATCNDGNTYQLFAGTQDGSITAQAITQPLPLPTQLPNRKQWGQLKVFNRMWVDGKDITNFQVSYSVDGGPYSKPVALANHNMIGLRGKQIQILFTHSVAAAAGVTPMITYVNIYDWEFAGLQR